MVLPNLGGDVKDSVVRTRRIIGACFLTLALAGCSAGDSPDEGQADAGQAQSGDDAQGADGVEAADDYAQTSDNGVSILTPDGAIDPTGTWNVGARAGDFVYVAGMRGIDPETGDLVDGDLERVRQGFENMQLIAESEGATLQDAVRLVVYVTDMDEHRPLVNEVQEDLWGDSMHPPRSIIEVTDLNQDDIFEVEGTFYAPTEDSTG